MLLIQFLFVTTKVVSTFPTVAIFATIEVATICHAVNICCHIPYSFDLLYICLDDYFILQCHLQLMQTVQFPLIATIQMCNGSPNTVPSDSPTCCWP